MSRLTEEDIQRLEHDVAYAPYGTIGVELWDPHRFRANRSQRLDKKDRPPLELAFLLVCTSRLNVYVIDLRKVQSAFPEKLLRYLTRKDIYWLGAQDMVKDFNLLGVPAPPSNRRIEPAKITAVLALMGYRNYVNQSGYERLSLGHFAFWL